jgi:hypothetical protein
MIYFTLSNVSHIHHYLRFCEITRDKVVPFTISEEVISFFERHKIKVVSPKDIKVNSILQIEDLNKISNYLNKKINHNDQFIFFDRLMSLHLLFIVKKIAITKSVIYYEDSFVADQYRVSKFYDYSVRNILSIIKYLLKLRIIFNYFWTGDNKSLGVTLKKLTTWGVKINKLNKKNSNYFFDHKAKWIFRKVKLKKEKKNKFRIIFVLGSSVDEECSFYDFSLRRKIINRLINEFGSKLKLKYPPREKKFEFQKSRLVDNKLMLEEICHKNDVLISDYSTSLITCARLGTKTLSYLGMVKVKNKKIFNFWRQWLTKHNAKYPLFTNSTQELISCIRKYSS